MHHGHTTAVLAAIFQKVIAVDILRTSLDVAATHTNLGRRCGSFLLVLQYGCVLYIYIYIEMQVSTPK